MRHLPSVRGSTPAIARVAVPSPLRRCFDYWVPAELGARPLSPGVRVRVPFGKSIRVGIVIDTPAEPGVEQEQLKPIAELLDPEPVLPATLLRLLLWASEYYHHPVGDVFRTALPAGLRQGHSSTRERERFWACTEAGRRIEPHHLGRAQRLLELLRIFQAAPAPLGETELAGRPGWRGSLARLAAKGWVSACPAPAPPAAPARARLNAAQAHAVTAIRPTFGAYAAHLVDGVTGSGKTQVYLELIGEIVANGQQALVLVPEIGLTPQMVERFSSALSARIGVMHSGMSDRARFSTWLQARDGEIDVLIGTRSAVFVPLRRPGLFVVDEEHDLSFKQQEGLRYSARDLCVFRARIDAVPVVLGSATPSLESLRNAAEGRYRLHFLNARAEGQPLPRMRILDVRTRALEDGLSAPLAAAIAERLERDEQSLLFVNRRGFAPVLLCHDCGWVVDCERCDSHMVVHAAIGRMRCHHCGADRASPARCLGCGSSALLAIGSGTERVARGLAHRFPRARVARIDRDSVRRHGAMEAMLGRIRERDVDIVIGTQMVAKGHHFPDVTLVGILDADGGLFGADFRACERMAQLIVQVAGRAGRGSRAGEVYVQTHHPAHPLLQALRDEGFAAFAQAALCERAEAVLPPFATLALLRAESPQREPAFAFLGQAKQLALEWTQDTAHGVLAVLGPVAAPMERRGGRYRAQLLLQAARRPALHRMLDPWLEVLGSLATARKVRWSLDVDPQEMV